MQRNAIILTQDVIKNILSDIKGAILNNKPLKFFCLKNF